MRRIARWGVTVAAAVACGGGALAAGGCGASSTIDPVAQAASVSTTSPGYQMRFLLQFNSPQLPTAITATGNAFINARNRAGSVAFAMDVGSIPELKKAYGSSTVRFQELVQGTTVYLKLPKPLVSKLPNQRPWLKFDLAKASGIPGLGSLANNPASSDPSQMLSYLRATSGGISKQGSQVVNGVQTTHYRATISLEKVPNAFPASSRKGVKQAVASIEQLTGLRKLPVDVWVDGKNLVRRMRLVFAESVAPSVKLNLAMTMDFVKYGPQPTPAFPSASQVTDASSLAGVGG